MNESICEESDSDPNFEENITTRAKYYRARRDSENLNISLNRSDFLDNLALMADKTLISSRTAVEIAGATLSTANNLDDCELTRLTLSHRSLHRKRDEMRLSHDQLITEAWKRNKADSKFLLHWDEKTLKQLRQVDGSNSYMAVVLTDLLTGEEKILSIIEMESSKAEEGAAAVIDSLEHWKINKKQIIGCVFDTTNTNSGGRNEPAFSKECK